MGEIVSPNPTQKQRFARIQSPTSPFFLGSNDDNLERARSRAARAAANRRKSFVAQAHPQPDPESDSCLNKQQILDLFHNCIKLASENKINQKNTWELNLIDHLGDIIKVEEEEDVETNFQKASCTLEAGVKIYSLRVDSVHSEAYKVLGGINRAGLEDEQDGTVEGGNTDGQEEANSKKESDRKISPLSTLETSFEALNAKKFDVAFAVDPLYHQTSAQFDEGGAKGLLLNNLGVYGGCRVLFDSQEVPGRCMSSEKHYQCSDTIDLSFAKDQIEFMIFNMRTKDEISPTLRNIVLQFDEDNRRPSDIFIPQQKPDEQVDMDGGALHEGDELDHDSFANSGTWNLEQDDQRSVVDEHSYGADTTFPSYAEEKESYIFENADMDDRVENIDGYLFLNLGFTSKQNAWAGPEHWKYRKTKGLEDKSNSEEISPTKTKKTKTKKQTELEIDFTKALDEDLGDIFAPPKNSKSLLLPANRAPYNTKLPEDCHYQPEDLVKLFLLPNMMCFGKRRRRVADGFKQQTDESGPLPSWDADCNFDGPFDDGNSNSDIEDPNTLVSQPRQVNKIEVEYDKTSKQIDVQVLKETLLNCLEGSSSNSDQGQEEAISFKNILGSFPSDCRAAATCSDISPHLCFICLLHLANEHGLRISGTPNLDDLNVHLPSSQ